MSDLRGGIPLDFKSTRGRELFLALVQRVDVRVENYRPTVMPRAGLGHDTLSARNPRLIYARVAHAGTARPLQRHGRPSSLSIPVAAPAAQIRTHTRDLMTCST